jgi:hypothetical protein
VTQGKLRISLYASWLISLLVLVCVLLLGPIIRKDASLGYEQIFAVIPSIIGLHIPALTSFAAFWFPQDERARAKLVTVDKERAFGALSLTWVYLLIVLGVVIWPVWIINYDVGTVNISETDSFASRINDAVKISLLLSPLAFAPSAYVTRTKAAA